jgi:hypothetical protein
MSISLGGNNVFQVGNSTQQFVITPGGALSFEGNTGGANPNPLQIKNAALRNTLDQTYTNLLTESFSQLTRVRATTRSCCFRRSLIPPTRSWAARWMRCFRRPIMSPRRSKRW